MSSSGASSYPYDVYCGHPTLLRQYLGNCGPSVSVCVPSPDPVCSDIWNPIPHPGHEDSASADAGPLSGSAYHSPVVFGIIIPSKPVSAPDHSTMVVEYPVLSVLPMVSVRLKHSGNIWCLRSVHPVR